MPWSCRNRVCSYYTCRSSFYDKFSVNTFSTTFPLKFAGYASAILYLDAPLCHILVMNLLELHVMQPVATKWELGIERDSFKFFPIQSVVVYVLVLDLTFWDFHLISLGTGEGDYVLLNCTFSVGSMISYWCGRSTLIFTLGIISSFSSFYRYKLRIFMSVT